MLDNLSEYSFLDISANINSKLKAFSSCWASIERIGNMVILRAHDLRPISSTISVQEVAITVPEGYRPSKWSVDITPISSENPASVSIRAILSTDGSLNLIGAGSGYIPVQSLSFTISYFCA